MALLTALQIATALESATYSEELNAINPFVILDDTRREYPSIDVENTTGQENREDVPTTTDKQIYLIHLYYRVTGFGDADEPILKLLENEIFDVIDGLQNTTTKIFITQSWTREHPTDPTPHIHSTLQVSTEEISSTKSGGITGDNITITFPRQLAPITFNVIHLITDKLVNENDMDLTVTAEQIFSTKYLSGILDVNLVLTPDDEELIDDLIVQGDDISITLTKGGIAFPKTVHLTSRVNSATRKETQSSIVSMIVKP